MFITRPMNVLFTLDTSLTRCVSNCPQLRLLSLLVVDDFITKTYNAEYIQNVTTTRLIMSNTMSKYRLIFGIEISCRHGVTLIKTQRPLLDMKYSPLS